MSVETTQQAVSDLVTWVEASASFEDDDEALESLVELKELDFGDSFTSRKTQLNPESGQSISITFAHDERQNSLFLFIGSDSDLNILLRLISDDVGKGFEIFNKIHLQTGSISVEEITIHKTYERPLNSLNLPIQSDTELDIRGIRIRHRGGDYIIQETEDDTVAVTLTKVDGEKYEEFSEGFILEDVSTVDNLIEEVLS